MSKLNDILESHVLAAARLVKAGTSPEYSKIALASGTGKDRFRGKVRRYIARNPLIAPAAPTVTARMLTYSIERALLNEGLLKTKQLQLPLTDAETETYISGFGGVEPNSVWQHHSGRLYTVLLITNQKTTQLEKFPVTVVYKDESGAVWSRPFLDFVNKMTRSSNE